MRVHCFLWKHPGFYLEKRDQPTYIVLNRQLSKAFVYIIQPIDTIEANQKDQEAAQIEILTTPR